MLSQVTDREKEPISRAVAPVSGVPSTLTPARLTGPKKAYAASKLFQMVFLGIFILGISMMFGEGSATTSSPFSSLSITTTIFGAAGAFLSELSARTTRRWDIV